MTERQLLIHIGYHKTATTWLQDHIFSNRQLGFASPWGNQAGLAVDEFVHANPFKFDPRVARAAFIDKLDAEIAKNLTAVLSNEALCGGPFNGVPYNFSRDVADRLHATFAEARILVTIREQKSSIFSHYCQYCQGEAGNVEYFLSHGAKVPGFAPPCLLDHFEYDLLIGYYQKLYGSESVLVMPYELLQRDPTAYLQTLLRFAGKTVDILPDYPPVRVRSKSASLEFRRQCNRIRFGLADWSKSRQSLACRCVNKITHVLDSIVPSPIHAVFDRRIRTYIDRHVGNYYAESNKRLCQLIRSDLSEFGYVV